MQTNMFQLSGVDQCIRVHGEEGMKAYSMGPNCRVPLFDDTDDILFVKTTDQNGYPSARRFRLVEEVMVDSTGSGNGVSLNDIRAIIRDEITAVKEELLNAQQPIPTTLNVEYTDTAHNESNATHSAATGGKHHGNKQQRPNTPNVERGEKQQ